MARLPNKETIYQAADAFRRESFSKGRSLLWPEDEAWQASILDQLWTAMIGRPDEGDRSFEEKLQDQLAPLPDDAHRVMADAIAFYYLFPSKVNPETKLAKVQEVISWRLKESPRNVEILERAFTAGGIGGAGTHYNMSKPWQLAYILKFARKALTDRTDLTDASACEALADQTRAEVPRAAEARHILLHLMFPDQFERIASERQKKRVVEAFAQFADGTQNIDAALANIRRALVAQYQRPDVDFYDRDIRGQWYAKDDDEEGNEGGAAAPPSLKQGLDAILGGYVKARKGERFGNQSPMFQLFGRIEDAFRRCAPVRRRATIRVKASPGQGNWVGVPWIAFLDERETTTTQNGVYCVYLFREDMSGVYLTLNQGVTQPTRELGWRGAEPILRETALRLRKAFPELASHGFALTDDVDLRAHGNLGEMYEVSTIAHTFYEAGRLPPNDRLIDDLDRVLEVYGRYVDGKLRAGVGGNERRPPRSDLSAVADVFGAALRASHVSFGSRHDDVVRAFVASLATKRFAILTGLSGSGKTQLALRFGEWLGRDRSLVVPVRPDWTGAEALFGYEDALREAENGRRAWQVPTPLAFMLRAARDLNTPYLLVLDEMNLAHVERYFADVLSGMESDYPCLPNLQQEDDGLWRVRTGAPSTLVVPKNLFVVGTVNVDETTYMFSPKVLDRANTFEFRVRTEDLETSHQRPVPLEPGDADLVSGFLAVAVDDRWHIEHPAPGQDLFTQHLRALHALLTEAGFEFGHRLFYEAIRFAAMYAAAGDDDPMHALDLQVMQKVLPRLHGSRRRLEPTLCALGRLCSDLAFDLQVGLDEAARRFDELQDSSTAARLPQSFEKVARMIGILRSNQFVSFTE